MLPMVVFLAVVLGLALRGTTSEDRVRFGRVMLAALRFIRDAVTKPPAGGELFHEALKARSRWALVTPTLAGTSVSVFAFMLLGSGELADARTLIDWGGSIGPRTTNGEWWRLATAMFVHVSVLHLFGYVAGLVQVGLLVERLVGPFAFTAVYAASGLLAGLWTMSAHPVSVSVGAAGAVFGVYGLLLASIVWGLIQRSTVTIPLVVLKGLWPGAAIFTVYHVVTEGLVSESMQAGLVVGLASGVVLLAGRAGAHKPAARRVCAALGASLAIVVLVATPLRGLADVTGEVASVTQIEKRTATAYDRKIERFRAGRVTADELAQFADAIASELQSASLRLTALDKVPPEHQAMFANTSEYLRRRQDSWRLRSEGLRAGRMRTLQQADVAENAALSALRKAEAASGQTP